MSDSLIDVQIHGPIELGRDVAELVLHMRHESDEDVKTMVHSFTDKFGVPFRFMKVEEVRASRQTVGADIVVG